MGKTGNNNLLDLTFNRVPGIELFLIGATEPLGFVFALDGGCRCNRRLDMSPRRPVRVGDVVGGGQRRRTRRTLDDEYTIRVTSHVAIQNVNLQVNNKHM